MFGKANCLKMHGKKDPVENIVGNSHMQNKEGIIGNILNIGNLISDLVLMEENLMKMSLLAQTNIFP